MGRWNCAVERIGSFAVAGKEIVISVHSHRGLKILEKESNSMENLKGEGRGPQGRDFHIYKFCEVLTALRDEISKLPNEGFLAESNPETTSTGRTWNETAVGSDRALSSSRL